MFYDVSFGYPFELLGHTFGHILSQLFILMGLSDGVERGKEEGV